MKHIIIIIIIIIIITLKDSIIQIDPVMICI